MTINGRCKLELYNSDCMDAMRGYKDNEFELCITDPPYGIGNFQQSDGNYKPVKWNDAIPTNKYFNELKRISKKRIIWGANYFNCFEKGGAIIWDKMNMHPCMSRCEIASKSFEKKVDYFQYVWQGFFIKDKEPNSFHPCQKPVALYKWLLKNYAKPGDRILDTHGGSMSLAIACWDMQFDLVAFEIDKDYFDAAIKRIKEHTAQQKLF